MENQNQSPEDQDGTADTEETGYTPGETEFADGKDTRLNRRNEELETDPETEDSDDQDTDPEDDDEDADYENPQDDPA